MITARSLSFFLALFFSTILSAQEKSYPEIDSLLSRSERFLNTNPDSMLKYAFRAAELSQTNNATARLARSFYLIGKAYGAFSEMDNQITYFQKALDLTAGSSNEKFITELSLSLAEALFSKGKPDEAYLLFRKVKASAEKSNDKDILYEVYAWQGNLCISEDRWDSADYFIHKMIDIALADNDSSNLAHGYRQLSFTNFQRKKIDEGMKYSLKAQDLYTRINNAEGLARTYKDMGDLNWELKNNDKAIGYYTKAYEIQKARKNVSMTSIGACDLAYMYALLKRKDLLDKYGDEAYSLARQTKSWSLLKYNSKWLSEAYEKLGDHKKALFYYKALLSVNDSLNDKARIEKNSREALESGFEEKVRNLKEEEAKRLAIAEEREQNQKAVRNILIVGFLIALILLFIAYRSYIAKKKANVIIQKQKEEVEMQKHKIEEINKEMTDSINYAKIIQRSILPDPKEIMKFFPECFGLYKPKSVVSGDFYWFSVVGRTEPGTRRNTNASISELPTPGSRLVFIAAVDCTGHGVPGALMSMIGVEKLNEAVENNITRPAEILSYLNKGVKTTLRQKDFASVSKDGMDIALCCFDAEKSILKFAGAMRPLWIIRNKELFEYKSTKASLGGTTPDAQEFISHEIQLQKGDSIYIFTDGFADQFGGEKGKKIMTKNFKELLLSSQDVPFLEQENILNKRLMEWQGDFEQVDDILVIGIRI